MEGEKRMTKLEAIQRVRETFIGTGIGPSVMPNGEGGHTWHSTTCVYVNPDKSHPGCAFAVLVPDEWKHELAKREEQTAGQILERVPGMRKLFAFDSMFADLLQCAHDNAAMEAEEAPTYEDGVEVFEEVLATRLKDLEAKVKTEKL